MFIILADYSNVRLQKILIKIKIYWVTKPHTQFSGLQLSFHTLLYGTEKHKIGNRFTWRDENLLAPLLCGSKYSAAGYVASLTFKTKWHYKKYLLVWWLKEYCILCVISIRFDVTINWILWVSMKGRIKLLSAPATSR